MAANKKPGQGLPAKAGNRAASRKPGWADGLKQLYDDVVDEPIPDAFMDLLAKLDEEDILPSNGSSSHGDGTR